MSSSIVDLIGFFFSKGSKSEYLKNIEIPFAQCFRGGTRRRLAMV
jgi:hypothetical protein